ncbi:MAG: TonB-dependent receptor, partial [candidate division Zixibacteria bacterium]|nr:TonB-dependent receptor [candidate division Zixibacteria bacterium]
TNQLNLTGSMQFKYLRFSFKQTKMGAFTEGYRYSLKWLFLSPRFGLNYTLNDQTDLFFSFAVSSREPDDGTIYDADDPDAKPAVYRTKLTVDSERVYDLELGGHYKGKIINFGANVYWMEFYNEIIPSGALDDDGAPVLGNADRSVHAGLELSGDYRAHKHLTLSGNVSFSYNQIKDYCVYKDTDWNGVADDTIDFSGNPVAGFPDYIANLLVDSRVNPLRFVFRLRALGRQYTENGGRKDVSIDPYLVASLSTSVRLGEVSDFGCLTVSGRVDNLFNEEYESCGFTDDWGSYYIPASERSFYVQLKWEME